LGVLSFIVENNFIHEASRMQEKYLAGWRLMNLKVSIPVSLDTGLGQGITETCAGPSTLPLKQSATAMLFRGMGGQNAEPLPIV
jgi:hypothetical protein